MSNQDYYYAKYLKYKNKYKEFKNTLESQSGGALSTRELLDEIHFWLHQFEEHALFLHLGIVTNLDLKQKGLVLNQRARQHLQNMFVSKGIDEHKIALDESDFAKLGNDVQGNIDQALSIVAEIKKYKQQVLAAIIEAEENGSWIGWIYQSFAEHVLLELDFFQKMAMGTVPSVRAQCIFWNRINAEHVGMASHFLDPTFENDEDIAKADTQYHECHPENPRKPAPTDDNQFLVLTLQCIDQLDVLQRETERKVTNGEAKSVIHPTLAAHDVREGLRAKYALSRLRGMAGNQQQDMMMNVGQMGDSNQQMYIGTPDSPQIYNGRQPNVEPFDAFNRI